ncbi:DUF4124 domain-containing protein [Dyella monticola]|uniref:DUF4124 domain-containing protein n=1 Tax=Dyella monticola TaxID=1927958 RepID=A0A370WTJ5_9GAMM|nr:DUF4124 domain-containing protein [Dyella monticola]RDS79346.1 DUF4124 domain-containing protein [Dyella monticola]
MRAFAFLLLLMLVPVCAKAQGDIHRCIGADGIPVFTDRACADVNAKPALPAPASTASAPASASTSQPPAVTCATDVQQLKQAVIDAFADRKPNRLAGLMLWSGDEKDAAVADIRLFTRLMSHPLLSVQSEPASSSSASADGGDADASQLSLSASPNQTPAHGDALIVQTESDDGSGTGEQTRFDVVHRSGCVWLQLQ